MPRKTSRMEHACALTHIERHKISRNPVPPDINQPSESVHEAERCNCPVQPYRRQPALTARPTSFL
eukprot:364347-Chlamydomonas_euryale.AAC.9